MITWSYGVTTVPTRIASGMLQRTLESLAKGGFPNPRLFIDGLPNAMLGETVTKLEVTCHNPPIRIYGNFHLGLSELFIRNPKADYYAMFQDDMVTYVNLRQYLESCEYPEKGYLNLYTFRENEKDQKGWYLSNQMGKGAVALVFSNDAVRALLQTPFWIFRMEENFQNKARQWKFIDGGIVEALRQNKYKEYVHNPSLVQHTGDRSTLGNSRHSKASTFRGEDFDVMDLITKRKVRIGLVSYNTPDDRGNTARKIAGCADIYRWLIKPHPVLGMLAPPDDVDWLTCPIGAKVQEFVDSVDVVIIVNDPCYHNLLDTCRACGKRILTLSEQVALPEDEDEWSKFNESVRAGSCYEGLLQPS